MEVVPVRDTRGISQYFAQLPQFGTRRPLSSRQMGNSAEGRAHKAGPVEKCIRASN
jgi:hypothetical protein